MKSLKQYLQEKLDRGIINHSIRTKIDSNGKISFQIYSTDDSETETLEFEVTNWHCHPVRPKPPNLGKKHIITMQHKFEVTLVVEGNIEEAGEKTLNYVEKRFQPSLKTNKSITDAAINPKYIQIDNMGWDYNDMFGELFGRGDDAL